MAYATPREIERVVTEQCGATLLLNDEEAQMLADLLARIGGDPSASRLRHASTVAQALRDAGYDFMTSPMRRNDGTYQSHSTSDLDGRLTFL